MLHDGEMHGVACRHLRVSQDNFFGAICDSEVYGKHLINNAENRFVCGLDCVTPIDGDVPMENLLEDFSIGHEALTLADQSFQ